MFSSIKLLIISCLSAIALGDGRYGKDTLSQKYKYNTWAANRAGVNSWLYSDKSIGSNSISSPSNMMRHYPMSLNKYQAITDMNNRQEQEKQLATLIPSEYYNSALAAITGIDIDHSAYEPRVYGPRTPYESIRQPYTTNELSDYAVVRYPNYGYYPSAKADANRRANEDEEENFIDENDKDDEDQFGLDNKVRLVLNEVDMNNRNNPAVYVSYYNDERPMSLENRYLQQQRYYNTPLTPRYSTADKMHKFRKLFLSNPVSPSNAFKSSKEQQLHDFWESLIQGKLLDPTERDSFSKHRQQLMKQVVYDTKHQFRQQQKHLNEDNDITGHYNSNSRISQYNQWANGSPLIKRLSPGETTVESDDVHELEQLKSSTVTPASTVPTIKSTVPTNTGPMANGGQREYVLPRPAGEKSSLESLLEVIAEGGVRGLPQMKLHHETKRNKKRSYVSDETSLAAELGALRKN
ncbi:uncharacterized protein LOC126896255 [Daktulosphaira vitifoliae]|uniref:uncharacterized protein LOC126896255 n=1 Tax=Daktulosphaira vitifoliae TaxID=58002 RepID=UPI0021A99BE4|nr:uncharacterized protein LOC126896255 [Daktulosphaira vitifoliae]